MSIGDDEPSTAAQFSPNLDVLPSYSSSLRNTSFMCPQPERYYQVSREEGHDGRFYSKISAVDWDDL
jgi:hypothetical protein